MGLQIAESLDDAELISAALDASIGVNQADDWENAAALSRRRAALADRLSLRERLDVLGVLAWANVMLGELDQATEAADAGVALMQPGQNVSFVLACTSWSGYVGALQGDWARCDGSMQDFLRRWIDVGRLAAAFALQGILSATDWGRNRRTDFHDRLREAGQEIVTSFPQTHPVAALASLLELDLDGIVKVVISHERYPDRAHYVEHALALLTDRGHAVQPQILDRVIERAKRVKLRVLEAQALRALALSTNDPGPLGQALDEFATMGAERYAARVRCELGWMTGDAELAASGQRQMDTLGEADLLLLGRT
jgi:hypothetical protein